MSHDPRDAIWNKTFETYYESYFYELVADKLVDRWQLTDDVTKVLVAITASGSAISGWALWQDPGVKWLWAIVAGIGAVLAIVHAALGVPNRIKDWEDIKRSFVSLRVNLETFRHRMEIDPNFPVDGFTNDYAIFRKQFGELVPRQKNDILRTKEPVAQTHDRALWSPEIDSLRSHMGFSLSKPRRSMAFARVTPSSSFRFPSRTAAARDGCAAPARPLSRSARASTDCVWRRAPSIRYHRRPCLAA